MEKNQKIQKEGSLFGPGSSYQPGPMTPPLLAARLATWSPFGPGSWPNRDQHWPELLVPGVEPGPKAHMNRDIMGVYPLV